MFHRFFLHLMLLCIVSGCSSIGKKRSFHSLGWIEDTSPACPPNHLCSVGSGNSYPVAESSARESLGKIFETRVVAKTQVASGLSKVEWEQDSYELTEEILDGVRVLRRGKRKGQFFALAALDQAKSARQIRGKIKNIDEKILAHYNSSDQKNLAQALKHFEERSHLNHRYRFLTGSDLPPPIGYRTIHQKIDRSHRSMSKKRQKNVVFLHVTESPSSQKIEQALIRRLLSLHYRIVLDSQLPHTFVLKVASDIRQEHFRVEGFEAYRLTLTFTGKMRRRNMGSFNLSALGIGRSQSQAENHGLKKIFINLEKELDHLFYRRS